MSSEVKKVWENYDKQGKWKRRGYQSMKSRTQLGKRVLQMRTFAYKVEKGLKIGHNVFSFKMDELQQFLWNTYQNC